jgi:anti-sigma factor RsiW
MHLDDAQLGQLLDRDLAGSATAEVREHLTTCPECRSKLTEAETEDARLWAQLRLLDHAPPLVSVGEVFARARSQRPGWRRIAAGIFLALTTAGVAYAIPGSPLPRWVERIAGFVTAGGGAAPPTSSATDRPTAQAGIAVAPGKWFTIELRPEQGLDSAVITLTDAAELLVQARGGTTSFASDVGRLGVTHTGAPANLEIAVPRAAPWVELNIGGRQLWLKRGATIRSEITADQAGQYRFDLK